MDSGWPESSVIYHIYPRSFMDSNGDGVGDLPGVIEKLEYLKELGVNCLWFSPIYPSPQADFGYDVSDYFDIDSRFGSLEIFDELVSKLHGNRMKIVMDFVPNHTSSQHPWFVESRLSRINSRRDWYIWADPKNDGSLPNNWLSHFGGSAWTYEPDTEQYYLHLFDKQQPDLNWRNPEVEHEMMRVLSFWLDRGVDGFRVDAPYVTYKDPLLSDEPVNPHYIEGKHGPFEKLLHTKTLWQPESYTLMKKFMSVLRRYPRRRMVTEAWTDFQGLLKMYEAVQWKNHQPMNFSLITLPWKADIHKQHIDEYDKAVGDEFIPTWVLGNHDKHRLASRIGRDQARIAAMLLLTLRGLPFLYHGDEIGMQNGEIPNERIQDPVERLSPGMGLGRDPARTPIQWNDDKHAGFSTGEPWLPVASDYRSVNVELQRKDPFSILSLYKRLLHLRDDNAMLRVGDYVPVAMQAENVFSFIRQKGNDRIMVILNYDDNKKALSIARGSAEVLCDTGMKKIGDILDPMNVHLEGNEGLVVQIRL